MFMKFLAFTSFFTFFFFAGPISATTEAVSQKQEQIVVAPITLSIKKMKCMKCSGKLKAAYESKGWFEKVEADHVKKEVSLWPKAGQKSPSDSDLKDVASEIAYEVIGVTRR